MVQGGQVPRHVAIVMDGNGRWAEQRGLPRAAGHKAGGDRINPVTLSFAGHGVQYLTMYMFSTENWKRPKLEVRALLGLLERRIEPETRAFHRENIRIVHLGRLDRLPGKLKEKVLAAVELTRENTGLTLCLAFDYGARDEIVQAARRLVAAGCSAQNVDDELFARELYTAGIPDPDLLIRTGGERRLSNFLLWQAAYSELYFTPVLWPDFGERDIEEALSEYRLRQRRFGEL